MNTPRLVVLLLALSCPAFAADEADSRAAKITDRADATSQVSYLTVSNLDERFGFDRSDDRNRMVLSTATLELAIPIGAVSSVVLSGDETWTVKYQTKAGEATVTGAFEPAALLGGSSDFGSFSLPLARLKRLDFTKPGVTAAPAKRPAIIEPNGTVRSTAFDATLMLTDGSHLAVTQLRRNQIAAQPVSDPSLIARPTFAVISTNYTDFRLIRGETLQIIPFENAKRVEFLDDEVTVTSTNGTGAKMKLPQRNEEVLEGFTGYSAKGDFYVPVKFVKAIAFGAETK